MRQPSTYGGHLEIQAFTTMTGEPVVVYVISSDNAANGNHSSQFAEPSESEPQISIVYMPVHQHYDIVIQFGNPEVKSFVIPLLSLARWYLLLFYPSARSLIHSIHTHVDVYRVYLQQSNKAIHRHVRIRFS